MRPDRRRLGAGGGIGTAADWAAVVGTAIPTPGDNLQLALKQTVAIRRNVPNVVNMTFNNQCLPEGNSLINTGSSTANFLCFA